MKTSKKVAVIVTAIIGCIVVAMGVYLLLSPAKYIVDTTAYNFDADTEYVKYAAFGADFYTYIYEAAYTMVGELSDANQAMEIAIKANLASTNALISTIWTIGSMIIAAIGLSILSKALGNIDVFFEENTHPAMKDEIPEIN